MPKTASTPQTCCTWGDDRLDSLEQPSAHVLRALADAIDQYQKGLDSGDPQLALSGALTISQHERVLRVPILSDH